MPIELLAAAKEAGQITKDVIKKAGEDGLEKGKQIIDKIKEVSESNISELVSKSIEDIKNTGDGVMSKLEEIKNLTPEQLKERMDQNLKQVKENLEANEKTDIKEVAQVVKNKLDGCERENQVEQELKEKYPESEGYQVVKEAYLRDENGKFVTDPETGERRRIDFVVVKDGKVVKSVEVTSMTAPKEEQQAKEQRIREAGGNYIRDNNGDLAEFPSEIETEIERRQ